MWHSESLTISRLRFWTERQTVSKAKQRRKKNSFENSFERLERTVHNYTSMKQGNRC